MTIAQPIWLTTQAHGRLMAELDLLNSLATGRRDGDDANAVAIEHARRSRIQRIHDLLLHAVVGQDPPDDGVAEPGMVLTVRFADTGETETFLLGVGGVEYGDLEVYTVTSPLGAALVGARPGDQRDYQVPSGATMSVTLVKAVPYGLHMR
ncbi:MULTISPECIES: GreA/GreB family elongation factor [Mycolicibacterium]|jgi:transcription elongation factor GreA|uniref:GreA/GreB family elongation factor n=2 Tax=Mycolicibacterium TaxID=1866885 RepID=A0A378TDJ7_9MYCO|nr:MULTISPECIES: GreA/GreB family elongation factor [Mycolicibacterium]ANW62945.1 transcription elongation factor GreAB [Mycobacterium sp. djl-10]MCV7181017.1 GreA/GreB family elongation factor [Mycolicibacterium murale]STZ58700.1 GreA/GreB family elongation factor [Mycolicibacterium tokaiense]BBY86795.1 transcription elongation factor GreA [Mycolicibacterium tokaiense]GFG61988.1 transcription elongation factor GreA [Mycolicibacterium murale]